MPLEIFAHPFSSYCQKVLIVLYENDTPFQLRMLGPDEPGNFEEFSKVWPIKRMPLLLDDGRPVVESTIIIEYLQQHHPGPVRLIPENADEALESRFMDRFFDNYVMTPIMKCVADSMRPAGERDARGVQEAHALLDSAYAWLDSRMQDRRWAVGDAFTLADCGAAPFLFYADWTHRIPASLAHVHAYRRRLLARPSVVRAVDDARPYRSLFPLGAPDRD
jgi:glutathione S-transferase